MFIKVFQQRELGIDAGFLGTVDHVYKVGRKGDVELSDGDGITFGYVTVEADPEPHVVAYYVVEEDQEAAARGIFVASR